MTFPNVSVLRSELVSVPICKPPLERTRPAMVEEALVAEMRVVEMPPAKVEVAVEVEVSVPTVRFPAEVEARYELLAYKVPVLVALTKVWPPVQELALARLREAMTAPVVGEIVRVPSALETEETPVTRQLPSVPRKQPPANWMPFANVEVAVPV